MWVHKTAIQLAKCIICKIAFKFRNCFHSCLFTFTYTNTKICKSGLWVGAEGAYSVGGGLVGEAANRYFHAFWLTQSKFEKSLSHPVVKRSHNRQKTFGTDGTKGVGAVHLCQAVLLAEKPINVRVFLYKWNVGYA